MHWNVSMKKLWSGLALLAFVAAVLLARWFSNRHTTEPAPGAAAAQEAVIAPDTLRYPEGAAQLAMIRSKVVVSSRVPLSDALNARLVYDEDVTARIGVGVSGRVVAIKAAPGDAVKAGQVLAEIDSPDLGSAYADLNKARADEDRKRLALVRADELVPGEAIPMKDWESLKAELTQARAETSRAEQRVRNLNPLGLAINGQRLSVLSPIVGVVTDRSATPALEVGPGMAAPLFVVTDPRRLWLLIDVPERLAGRISRGSAVEIASDAFPDERFIGTVVQQGQLVDVNTRRVTVRARLDNPQRKLLPEMFVRARVLQERGAAVGVPNAAIVNKGVYAYVFVQTGPSEFQRRRVSLLTQGADMSYIGEGLEGGERIVEIGALLLDAELTAREGDTK